METKGRLISLEDLWANTIAFYRKHARNLLAIGLVIVALMLVSAAFGAVRDLVQPDSAADVIFWSLTFVTNVVAIVFAILFPIALIEEVAGKPHHAGQAPDVAMRDRYSEAGKKVWSYLFVVIMSALITLGATLLFVFPGIYVQLMLGFSAFVFVVEGKKGFHALSASWKYMRGHWWAVFGRLIVFGLAVALSVLIVREISVLLDLLFWDGQSLSMLLPNIFQYLVVAPISIIYSYEMYRSLVSHGRGEPTHAETVALRHRLVALLIVGIAVSIIALSLFTIFVSLHR